MKTMQINNSLVKTAKSNIGDALHAPDFIR